MKMSMKITAGVLVACAVVTGCTVTKGVDTVRKPVRKPKALVIMLDGMRADSIENVYAPNLRMLRDGKWQPDYKCAWSLSAHTIYDAITVSGPNHTSIATGVTSKKHTIKQNHKSTCDFKKWPSWLVRVADARPGTKGLFMYSWRWDHQISPDPRIEFIHGSGLRPTFPTACSGTSTGPTMADTASATTPTRSATSTRSISPTRRSATPSRQSPRVRRSRTRTG